MFLSIDAGNSNIVFGFFNNETSQWTHELRIETKKDLSSFELQKNLQLLFLENNLKTNEVTQIGFSSVVPELEPIVVDFCRKLFGKEPYVINGKSYEKLRVSTSRPHEIGSDLMANVAAAYALFQESCIIVDFGTALTFSVVDDQGYVVGVNIVPGLKTAMKSLFLNTAKLPEVNLELPASALGKNTAHAIQAGVLYGYVGLVRGMLERIGEETARKYKVIATGGLSEILPPLKDSFDQVDKKLTLKGIKLITEVNTG